MTEPRLRPRGARAPRCPLCREDVPAGADAFVCPACGVGYHAECVRELGGCATLACPRAGEPPSSLGDEVLAAVRARALDEAEEAHALADEILAAVRARVLEDLPAGAAPPRPTNRPTPEELEARQQRIARESKEWAREAAARAAAEERWVAIVVFTLMATLCGVTAVASFGARNVLVSVVALALVGLLVRTLGRWLLGPER